MAALVLGAAVGQIGLTGFSLFAAQLAAGAIGSFIDSRLFARDTNVRSEGPRINNINVTSSAEGSAINRMYGRMRVGGQIIWASRFEEQVVTTTTTQSGGGKGGGGSVSQTSTTYKYFISWAVALCEGNARTSLGRVWADGRLLDLSNINYRFYPGTSSQSPDSFIQTVEGAANAPAFRGTTYIMFERVPLEEFGNRMPQITAEVIKPIITADPDKLENALKGINLIPATGEFVYGTIPYVKDDNRGNSRSENVHRQRDTADVIKALDDLEAQLPNVETVNLIVSWFGDDLRAGSCKIKPKVELAAKTVFPADWLVNGVVRANASVISVDAESRPVYGGTPSDDTVVQLIQELTERGFRVCFYPFVLMDITGTNTLPNPYTANTAGTGQDAFPWRGRITISPAIGQTGTVDKTLAAATQINAFFGGAEASDFTTTGTAVSYTGGSPTEFGYRRMILHYAKLCAAAGGVDAFFIGSEMVQITRARSSSSAFPGVTQFVDLAADISAILGGSTLVSYAANWDEYHSHRPDDGTNDVYFNMDPLWQSSDIDFIAIDNYLPIADWRNGTAHLDYDAINGPTKIYDKVYLKSQIEGGEYFDYYYASEADRNSQTRTAIVDSTYSKPWVFANKNIRAWWGNSHYNRPAGVQSGLPTSYTHSTKPIWFSEFGCPAVDKGANQPNVFYDPKSDESAFPYYSSGRRDDFMQRMYYEAMLAYWRDEGGSMVDVDNMMAWTWDARPYPAYPLRSDFWSDGANYKFGHWLNGRVGASTLAELITELCGFVGFTESDLNISNLTSSQAVINGYLIDSVMSPRDMIAPLEQAFLFDSFESEGNLTFVLRGDTTFTDIATDQLVVDSESNPGGYQLTRTKETDLPLAAKITFIDEENAYQPGSVPGLKLVGSSKNVITIQFPIVLSQDYARALADVIIQESWAARETAEIALPPSFARLDPGDGISVTIGSRELFLRIGKINRGPFLRLQLAATEPSVYETLDFSGRGAAFQEVPVFGRSVVRFLDLPLVTGQEERPWAPRVAGYQNPFPSAITVYRSISDSLELMATVNKASVQGELTDLLYSNRPWCWDRANNLVVQLYDVTAAIESVTEDEVLAGKNAVAVQNANGGWEVIQFSTATLLDVGKYKLTNLLRGQLGTETEMRDPVAIGAPVVFLNPQLFFALQLPIDQKFLSYEYSYGPAEIPTSSDFYRQETLSFTAAGLLPYAPTRLWVIKSNVNGEATFTWQRRTRFNGDDFDSDLVPLNEEFEKYDLEIYSDNSYTTLVRSLLDLTTSTYVYSAANQIADFGSTQSQFSIRIYQKSADVGRGRRAQETVYTGI